MSTHADKPIMRVSQGESVKLAYNGDSPQEITCDDMARLALAMHEHSYFFSLRRGLHIRFSRDLCGSGTQGILITRESDEINPPVLFQVGFRPNYERECEFLYEADLIMDRRYDDQPSINKGKHRFVAGSAFLQIDWNSEEAKQWRFDIKRLSNAPDTLADWVAEDLEMLVKCGSGYFFCNSAILTQTELKRHLSAGLSLEDLKNQLKCSKCGRREARLFVF